MSLPRPEMILGASRQAGPGGQSEGVCFPGDPAHSSGGSCNASADPMNHGCTPMDTDREMAQALNDHRMWPFMKSYPHGSPRGFALPKT